MNNERKKKTWKKKKALKMMELITGTEKNEIIHKKRKKPKGGKL